MIKMIFRYSFKHKANLIAISFFTLLSILIFNALMMISSNLKDSYNYLVDNGNLNNGVIYEMYSTTVKQDDPTTANDETQLTGDEAKKVNEKLFKQNLINMIGDEYKTWRPFYSIDYNTTNSGFVYKVVETNNDYTIDKLVMYGGNKILKLEYDFNKIINEANWNNTGTVANDARTLLLSIICRAKFSDGDIKNGYGAQFKKLQNDTKGKDIKTYIDSNPSKIGKLFKSFLTPNASTFQELRDKIYRLSFSIPDNLTPASFNFDNFSSYGIVVPQYVLDKHQKEILPANLYNDYKTKFCTDKSTATQVEFEDWLKTIPNKYKIQIDNSELIVLGTGISPDFMYPVYDFAHITPNTDTEVLSYGNIGAYGLVQDANRSCPTDNYLVLKVPNLDQAKVDEINKMAQMYMTSGGLDVCYLASDTSNVFSPTGIRVNFLPQLINMQIALSNILSFFIGFLTCFIFIFTVQKFIYDNKSSLAILRANGFKKRWIILMMPLFALIPSVFGWAIGYTIAQLTQTSLLGLYSSYWVIPTTISAINPLLFVFTLIVPFAVMSVLGIIFTYWILRKNTRVLMSESSRFKITPFAKLMNNLLPRASVITKFKAGVSFSSIPKLIGITLLFTLLSVVMSFSTSLIGKFQYIKSSTFDTKKYKFALDFITPTIQGGGYITQSFKDAGKPVINNNNQIVSFNAAAVDNHYNKIRGQIASGTNNSNFKYYDKNFNINPNLTNELVNNNSFNVTNIGTIAFNHLPSFNDSEWQANQITYLKYRIESPLFVDTKIGLGTNPWNIARALMPSNSISQSNKMTTNVWLKMMNDNNVYFTEQNILQYNFAFSKKAFDDFKLKVVNRPLWDIIYNQFNYVKPTGIDDPKFPKIADTDKIYIKNNANVPEGWYYIDRSLFNDVSQLKYPFLIIINNLFYLDDYQEDLYKVLYNIAVVEENDETYTKAMVKYETGNNSFEDISLIGIKPNSKFVDLINKDDKDVKYKLKLNNNIEEKCANNIHEIYKNQLLKDTFEKDQSNFKLIINQSAAYQYNLDIGSKIVVDPTDEATRFNPKDATKQNIINLDSWNNKKYSFEVVDIIETYQNPEFYINQRVANYINNMYLQPILEQCFYTKYNYDTNLNQETSYQTKAIDPWNGLFSNEEINKNVSVSQILYSPSGLAPPGDKISLNNANYQLIQSSIKAQKTDLDSAFKQEFYIAKMDLAKSLGYVDPNTFMVTPQSMAQFETDYPYHKNNPQLQEQQSKEILNKLIATYSDSPFLSSVNNVMSVSMFTQIFDNTSDFVNNMLILVLIIVFIISILSIMILSIDFINSSIALCSILKALGIYDRTNAFNFLSMFFPAAFLAIIISIPVSIVFNNFIMDFIYGFSNILLPISYQWWLFLVATGFLGVIIGITIAISIIVLKRQNLPKAISGF